MFFVGGQGAQEHSQPYICSILASRKEPVIARESLARKVKICLIIWTLKAFEVTTHRDDSIFGGYRVSPQQTGDLGNTAICSDQYPGLEVLHSATATG